MSSSVEYQGHPGFENLVRALRNKIFSLPRRLLTHTTLSEKNWYAFVGSAAVETGGVRPRSHRTRSTSQQTCANNGTHCGQWECSHSNASNIKGFACKLQIAVKSACASCVNGARGPIYTGWQKRSESPCCNNNPVLTVRAKQCAMQRHVSQLTTGSILLHLLLGTMCRVQCE